MYVRDSVLVLVLQALVRCSDRVAPARASEDICGCESTPPRAVRDMMQICKRRRRPLFSKCWPCDFATSSRDPNRVNFPHSRAGSSAACNGWISADLWWMHCTYDETQNQHIAQPGGNAILLWRLAYRFLTLSLMVTAPPCPPISAQSHTGKTTRECDGRRPGYRDGDALVQLLQPGDHGRQVCYNTLIIPLHVIPPCLALPDLPPHPSTAAHHFHPQPLHASSHSASHHRRPVRITLRICKRGLSCPTGHLTTPSAPPHASAAHSPDSGCHQHVPTWSPTRHSCYRRRLSSDVCCCRSA